MASPLTDIPDHLLAEIFLRLPTPADLARASTACVPFRRLATEGSFLRRFLSLHSPSFLAFLNEGRFQPALPPHPSAPAARALVLAADFTFSFIPSHSRWIVRDIRGGLVLLDRELEKDEEPTNFPELVVCDPLHRRYLVIPQVPDDLAPSLEHTFPRLPGLACVPFLLPLSEEAAKEEQASFSVIWLAYYETMMAAFVFSSSTGQWRAAASKAWSDLAFGDLEHFMAPRIPPSCMRRHYAYGVFYWDLLMITSKKMLVLDTNRMEFSVIDLPPGEWSREGLAIVEAGEGRLGMFGFRGEVASHLRYTIAQNKGTTPRQWQMEKTIALDSGYKYYIKAATERYLLLVRTQRSSVANPLYEYLSMDIKTLQLHMFV
ncbi:unnamed protein product [Triticum turgidum subsp. durum]|uniref:F-box domain-containing protein n=1 Tax=Triticum turgidum subsp. durum TaxID=4567 RepID=A0A9R1ABK6_TRITD|nr:unnamed protein product [Triticum turgidum subsp. durum]